MAAPATTKLKLAFFGTPDFAVPALQALVKAGHAVARVYTQPPRPAGRGQAPRPSSVQRAAERLGLPVETPASLKGAAVQDAFAALGPDAAVVVAYGLVLPKRMIEAPRLGCLNIHASLLPRWRGAAPIQRAILAGDGETGVTVMRLDEGLDTGPVVLAGRVPIAPDDDAGVLHDQLAVLGSLLIVDALDGLAAGRLTPRPQPESGVTYARKIDKAETRLDWKRPAEELARCVRAFAPVPGAWFEFGGERVRVLKARAVADAKAMPGMVLGGRFTIACGDGALRPLKLQRAGRTAMEADEYLRGVRMPAGTVLT